MKHIPLDELPAWSPWPARLLGLEPWQIPDRTIAKNDAEYDRDKYAQCLARYDASEPTGALTPDDLAAIEWGPADQTIACSFDDQIVLMTTEQAMRENRDLLIRTLSPKVAQVGHVVELGCGFGIQMWYLRQAFPAKSFLGGECSANAVRLAAKLYRDVPDIRVHAFNFYDERYDNVFEERAGDCVVFTSYGIDPLPSAGHFLDVLATHADSIHSVFHFEPVHEFYDDSLLGLLRKRYTEANDYNRDLLSQLESRANIRILQRRPNVFGVNPLHPTSVIEWEFC